MANNYKVKMVDLQNKYKFKIFCSSQMYDDSELKRELEAVYKAFPKASATGTSASLDGTAAAIMNIDLKGNGGKNLLDLSSFVNYTSQGVTFTKENGIIKATGTPTATSWNRRLNITLPAGTYTFSGVDNLNADGLRLMLYYSDNEQYVIRKTDSSKTFTLNEEKTYG